MKKTVITLAILALGTGVWAQENPARNAAQENGFIRVGEYLSSSRNNVGASAFLFPSGDNLVTGLHSSVSADTFLGGLKAVNSFYNQMDYNLVSYGWKGSSRGFHTVEVGVRFNNGVSGPKELFHILKTGTAQSPYNLSALQAFGNLYAQIAYGYARPVSETLSEADLKAAEEVYTTAWKPGEDIVNMGDVMKGMDELKLD